MKNKYFTKIGIRRVGNKFMALWIRTEIDNDGKLKHKSEIDLKSGVSKKSKPREV